MRTEFKPITFDSGLSGLNLLVTGAVHGNETCGPVAIHRIIDEFNRKALVPERGSVTFIPVCNPIAYDAGKRHVGGDLNRDLAPVRNPQTELDHIRNALCAELRKCDVLLDLHSLFCSQLPFVYVGPYDTIEREFARSLGVRHFIEGWEDAHKQSNYTDASVTRAVGTTEYARDHGAVGVTLECGNHTDPNAPIIGVNAIIGALNHFHLVQNFLPEHEKILEKSIISDHEIQCARMDRVYYQLVDGKMHHSNRQNFDRIARGDIVAVNDDGSDIRAERDGFIIMPDPRMTKAPPAGEKPEEWFYTAVESRLFHII